MTALNGTNSLPKVSLNVREYVDLTIKHERELAVERERFNTEKFLTIEEARRIAKVEQDRRLETMNEFREQLTRQANTFVTRELMEGSVERLRSEMGPLLKSADRDEGSRATKQWLAPSGTAVVAVICAAIAAIAAIVGLIT